MVKRMLIEATHPEETRVVVLDGTRLEEFDVETSTKKQIKGNIYLAKVVRVEPSLQAAFVDYGGNRHGFLAFSEIHPDYYQIPVADRERLMAEVQRQEDEDERRAAAREARDARRAEAQGQGEDGAQDHAHQHEADHDHAHDHHDDQAHAHDHHDHSHDDDHHEHGHDDHGEHDHGDSIPLAFIPPAITAPISDDDASDDTDASEHAMATEPAAEPAPFEPFHNSGGEGTANTGTETGEPPSSEQPLSDGAEAQSANGEQTSERKPETVGVETVGGEEEEEEAAEDKQRRRFVASRHYKIQEVIKRRQIMLIQVVKEERGNKGAALTTYLSLAGRYCVLMPNSPRGGGVSRKITSAQDRRRLKAILGDLELPKNMAVILRTAGAERNKAEIKRDYEYLQRTWNNIREVTMTSRAPAPIHEEASLIKRAIRDIYSRDIEEVWVEGEDGYKTGKDFMKMLTPSHAKKVQRYKDDIIPLFHRYQVESQMEAINSPVVQLRSGGSIVFAQTEALVAIDVNSGRATKERHIEETAYKTNCEAADEIARQLRLRDLAGLVVIDFIDMEDNRNNHAVERRLKEALKADRARIQVGRISHFGLLELSRQRLRPSLIEANFRVCAHCAGSGMVRSTESAAVYSLRMMEEEGVRQRSSEITITVHPDVALYLLNYKREALASIESRYRLKIIVLGDTSLVPPNIRLDRVKAVRGDDDAPYREPVREITHDRPAAAEADVEDDEEEEETATPERTHEPRHHDGRPREGRGDQSKAEGGREDGGRKRRRRRRRRGGELRNPEGGQPAGNGEFAATEHDNAVQAAPNDGGVQDENTGSALGEDRPEQAPGQGRDDAAKRGRRRGRRGGRRRRRGGEGNDPARELGADQNAQGSEGGGASDAAVPDTQTWSEPAAAESHAPQSTDTGERPKVEDASNGERGQSRGFFRALKETVSWRRNDSEAGESQTEAPAAPAVSAPAPAPAEAPAPPAPAPAPLHNEAAPQEQSGSARRGWWSQDSNT
jgi:ribonuclease E